MKVVLALILCATLTSAQFDPHFADGRNTIVQLFEWKWSDIASECENFLSTKGFAGVQISPPSENAIIAGRPWLERYQLVSYVLSNRGGSEDELADMITRCNNVGVRVYVDIVLNHMATTATNGTAGNTCDPTNKSYPAVPYTSENFHESCTMDTTNATSIRDCELAGLKDLDQSQEYVRGIMGVFLNKLISLGVAGFRVDLAKYIWPNDLSAIFESLDDLNTDFFPSGSRAMIYQEVDDTSTDPVYNTEYIGFGRVLEFKYGKDLASAFRGNYSLQYLAVWGPSWGLLDGSKVVAFIDNHDTERGTTGYYLNYKEPKLYTAVIAFMLAHSYDGITKITSSYEFSGYYDPPPANGDDIASPEFSSNGTCTNGWVCQHRWSPIYNMVEFRNVVAGTSVTEWWVLGGTNRIAFSRGHKGFFAATIAGDINTLILTGLPDGDYCDIISGSYENGSCTGKTVTVTLGFAHVQLSSEEDEAALAIHINARL